MANCLVCNIVLKKIPEAWKRKGCGKYCSRSCANKILNKMRAKPYILKLCIVCRKQFHTKDGVKKQVHCSPSCASKTHSKLISGYANPAWKGGVVPINIRIRNHVKSAIWRQSVFIRDKFTCVDCGQVGGALEAHHIKSFSTIMDEVRHNLPLLDTYEAALIYNPLWDTDNGKTLCVNCHNKYPRRVYVKENNKLHSK